MELKPEMVSLKTVAHLFDMKYDTLWKKFKKGEFVTGYRLGRNVRFKLKDVQAWAIRDAVRSVRGLQTVG